MQHSGNVWSSLSGCSQCFGVTLFAMNCCRWLRVTEWLDGCQWLAVCPCKSVPLAWWSCIVSEKWSTLESLFWESVIEVLQKYETTHASPFWFLSTTCLLVWMLFWPYHAGGIRHWCTEIKDQRAREHLWRVLPWLLLAMQEGYPMLALWIESNSNFGRKLLVSQSIGAKGDRPGEKGDSDESR